MIVFIIYKILFLYLNSVLGLSHWHYFHTSTGTPLVLRFGCDWILITWTLGMLYIPSFLFLEIRGSCDGHRVCLVCVVAYRLRELGLKGFGVYGMSRLYFLFLDFLWFVAFPLLFSSLFLYPLINIFYVLTTDN